MGFRRVLSPSRGLSRDCRWQGIDHAAAGRPDPPQHAGASVAMGDASMISRGSTRQTPNSVSAARARLLDEMKKAGVSDPAVLAAVAKEIGRASCRERVCPYV